jgi:hypothetical protein
MNIPRYRTCINYVSKERTQGGDGEITHSAKEGRFDLLHDDGRENSNLKDCEYLCKGLLARSRWEERVCGPDTAGQGDCFPKTEM